MDDIRAFGSLCNCWFTCCGFMPGETQTHVGVLTATDGNVSLYDDDNWTYSLNKNGYHVVLSHKSKPIFHKHIGKRVRITGRMNMWSKLVVEHVEVL